MKRKTIYKLLIGLFSLLLLLKISTILFIEPWIGKKVQAQFHEIDSSFVVKISDVDILFLTAGVSFENIQINSKEAADSTQELKGEIGNIKFKGINLYKVIFKREIDILELIISNGNFIGKTKIPQEERSPVISSANILIDKVKIENVDFNIKKTSSSLTYVLKDGFGNLFNIKISKSDTLSLRRIDSFDFKAEEVISISVDSLYEYKASGVIYKGSSGKLSMTEFSILPNYNDYDFVAQTKFQTDRIEATINNIVINDFNAADYIKSASIASSYVEIEKINMEVFRDKRKLFKHQTKPTFQDLIYNYPGRLNVDSLVLLNGSISYLEHVEDAKKRGKISFEEINARIYKISNDTIYKKELAYLEVKAEALLMGFSRIEMTLKSKIFDKNNTFSLEGSLAGMAAKELNPILENNAFLSVLTGKIDTMHFNFLATNTKSSGKLTLLYHELNIDSKVPQKNVITSVKDMLYKIIARNKILEANPLPKDQVRAGTIDFERDPERMDLKQ